jgi:hypothetical protein
MVRLKSLHALERRHLTHRGCSRYRANRSENRSARRWYYRTQHVWGNEREKVKVNCVRCWGHCFLPLYHRKSADSGITTALDPVMAPRRRRGGCFLALFSIKCAWSFRTIEPKIAKPSRRNFLSRRDSDKDSTHVLRSTISSSDLRLAVPPPLPVSDGAQWHIERRK